MREVDRKGFNCPLSWSESCGIFDCRSEGLVGKREKALGGSFELVCQLLGEERLAGIPSWVKRNGRRGWCAVEEEVCIMTKAAQVVYSEGQVHDAIKEELPKEFLISDDPC